MSHNHITFVFILFLSLLLGGCTNWNFNFNVKGKEDNKSQTIKKHKHNEPNKIPGYSTIQIDPSRLQILGVDTEKVAIRDLKQTVRTVGIVTVDETRVTKVQTKFNGWIEELYVDFVGIPVKENQPLFRVYSQELLATQEEYLVALKDSQRPTMGEFAEESQQLGVNLLHATEERLKLWDVPHDEIIRLKQTQIPSRNIIIRSPTQGIVLQTQAFAGMNVKPEMNIFTIADLSHVWVLADIYEDDISFVKIGQKGEIAISSLPHKIFQGDITFIDYVLDEDTRTTKVRFECENINHHLKPGMYAEVKINLEKGKWLALPEEAVIDTGKRKIVFVSKGKGRFEPREVQLGFKAGSFYQVISGIKEEDLVVTSAQFLFDSESRLKAFGGTGMKGHGM